MTKTNEFIEILKKLILIPSVHPNEKEIADYIEKDLANSGLRTKRIDDEVICFSKNFKEEEFVLFAGHVDTVPGSTCTPTERENRIYGRGSCDMKAGVAIMMELAKTTNASACFTFYTKEEVGLPNGITKLLEKEPFLKNAKFAFVPEPTDLTVQYGCNSRLLIRAIYSGQLGHASICENYENAIVKASIVAAKLKKAKKYLECIESFAVTGINGGNGANVIPDKCELIIDHRYHPSRYISDEQTKIKSILNCDEFEVIDSSPGCILDKEAARKVRGIFEKNRFKFTLSRGWMDIAQLQAAGIKAVAFGPGTLLEAHTENEFVDIKQLKGCYETYVKILEKF